MQSSLFHNYQHWIYRFCCYLALILLFFHFPGCRLQPLTMKDSRRPYSVCIVDIYVSYIKSRLFQNFYLTMPFIQKLKIKFLIQNKSGISVIEQNKCTGSCVFVIRSHCHIIHLYSAEFRFRKLTVR